jgi:lipopolysaccharide assembly outer membrane protein LptD (OstA)
MRLAVATAVGAALAALGFAAPSGAQAPPGTQAGTAAAAAAVDTTARADTLRLRAGRGRYFREQGEWVSLLEGGVRLESDSTTIDSRRARAYRTRQIAFFYEDVVVRDRGVVMNGDEGEFRRGDDIAILRGNVRITDRHGTIRAARVRYNRRDRVAWLWGDVDSSDDRTRVQADSVLYRQADGTGEAFGAVVITDLDTGSQAFGTHAVYDRETGTARLDPEPRLVLREEGEQDTEVRAADLQFDHDRSVVHARGNVQIQRGPTFATADSALLYRDEDRLLLRGHPQLRREQTTMRGREIDVFYSQDDVERVAVRQAAHLLQARADTALVQGPNEVKGDSAQLYFESGTLARAVVVGQASSVFAPEEARADRLSRNQTRADSILMRFENDEVSEVVFIGNAAGTYRFYEGDLTALRRPAAAAFDSTFGVVRGDTTGFDFETRAETVDYAAETILYLAPQNDLMLQRAAEVRYQGRTLRAGRIHYDADTDLLDARDRPALDDAGDRMYGDRMGYDLGTREAWISGGSTQYDRGFYTGEQLRKKEEGVLQVRHASYTTCDLAHPHYRFECDRMKIYLRKKIVGRSVGVWLGEVPIFWIPFIYNSTDTGRHSGFLQPDIEFGISSRQRFVRGLEYYWAASSYYDFQFSGDYLERERPDRSSIPAVLASNRDRSVRLSATARYKVRYKLDGNLDYSFRRTFGDAGSSYSYTIRGRHDQTIDERSRLAGSIDYASNSRAVRDVNEVVDYQRSLERNLSSGLTFNRRGDLVSVNASVQRREFLNPGPRFTGALVTWRNPDLRVTFRSIRLAPPPRDPKRERVQAFLSGLQLNPFLNFGRSTVTSRVLRDTASLPDSGSAPEDSFRTREDERIDASTSLALSRQARLGPLSLSPSVSYSENYQKDSAQPALPRHSRRVQTGMGSATTVYGLFYPRRFGIEALRHRIEPRASVSFTPEIAGQQRRSTGVALGITNTIDAKVRVGKETRRLDGLFDWSLATSYNPTILGAAGEPDRKFGNVSSTITINRSGPLRLTISQTYDPYRGRILSTSVPFALNVGGRFGYGDTGVREAARNRVVEEEGGVATVDTSAASAAVEPLSRRSDTDAAAALADVPPVAVGGAGDLTWGLTLAYTLTRIEGRTERARVPLTFRIQPTRSWEVSFGTTYDGATRELGQPSIRITRDLHCWKASFTRIRTFSAGGGDWQYYFRIFVDRHPDDLFIESGDRSYGYGY